jgi:hypothetical protein
MRRPEWPSTRRHNSADGPDRSWADQCGNASTSGSPADMSPSLSCAGAASVSRRIGVAASPLPPVNSIRQRASILPSSKQILRCVESECCKRMFQVFQIFRDMLQVLHMNVYKSRLGCCTCCICCKCFKRLFNMFHLFQTYVCKRFDRDVAYVSHICCKSMFQMFHMFPSYVAASVFILQVVFYLEVVYVAVVIHECGGV